MKRFLASIALLGLLSLGLTNVAFAQEDEAENAAEVAEMTEEAAVLDEVEEAVEAVEEVPVEVASGGFHKELKSKFIDGGPEFMSAVAIVFIIGLAFCLERIIYLNLADVNSDEFLSKIYQLLINGDVAGAEDLARDTRGPVASITYQALSRLDQGLDVVERSITAYGSVQAGLLEKNLSWITLAIALAPSLGFLGTVVGMVMAFDTIEIVGDMSPTVVAGGMKVALITTIAGLIVGMILQIFYNYILSKFEGIINKMESASIDLVDYIVEYEAKNK